MLYYLKRTLESILTLALVLILTFAVMQALPGGPFDEESILAPDIKARLEEQYGLTQPLSKQFQIYLKHLLHGDLGQSYYHNGRSVGSLVRQSWPVSALLGVLALVLALAGGITLGLISARFYHKPADRMLSQSALILISMPTLVIGPLLVWLFSFSLGWLPSGLWGSPKHLILPVLTLCLRPLSLILRIVRRSALEILRQDYIRTARAKGVSESFLLLKHTLIHSLFPVFAMTGSLMADLLTGSFVVEMIFAVPGLGRHFIEAVSNRDYPLILATTLLFSSLLIAANWLMDMALHCLDPRVESV